MKYFLNLILSVLLISCGLSVEGQINSSDADHVSTTQYSDTTIENHNIFVFYSSPGEDIKGSLQGKGPNQTVYNFEWSKFDDLTLSWNLINSENGVTSSQVQNQSDGGYKLRVFDGASFDTTYFALIFINNLKVSLLSNSDDQLIFGKYFCGKLVLDGSIEVDSFNYYEPISLEKYEYVNASFFKWTTDNTDFKIKPDNIGLSAKGVENPPAKDMWIILTATDSTGMTDVDSVFYETVEVEADFSMEFFDKIDTETYIEAPSPTAEDAPLTIRFANESLNGYNFEWIFTDTSNFYFPEIEYEMTENVDYQPEYTYKIPDHYYPALVAISEENCIDTFKLEDPIEVFPSELEAPNVFSPQGLENNRYFKVTFQSIKEFHIRIYSKTGNLVYRADVFDMYSWDGWDGNIGNSNRPAPAGTYYYIIEATGYDRIRYNHGPYKGFVYLFRPKN